ncbi:hypothetical protein [Desulfofustis glycolicus]|uniref:Uncharacterized protein n=1 Tax=Desulfofustis glycolicus DSM 9705 TaxID=1121409 RepID=A0A1M5SI04_9BACT|nr:hypothetical protein [Desulfofustis glycolicus]MCB2215825.1 hypothetical protein [Desulfobulbaceae bacterium]SHH37523.1 hypothetical protein SAMN02745124_00335 [Desulfofustis glycolicus DSM 9705]
MEYSKFQQSVIEAIKDCKSEVKNCCENALLHLEKAWLIKDIDAEMAVFRGITAEEEAAIALFFCLKKHQYNNANKLPFKQHPAKLGLYPFLRHIGNHLAGTFFSESSPFENHRLKLIDVNGRKALVIIFKLKNHNIDIRPLPPLHFTISNDETGEIKTFDIDFKELYIGDNYKNSLKYIEDVSSKRNRLLYANSAGKPEVKGDMEEYLNFQKMKVFLFIYIVLLIDPWEKAEGSSGFVQQALDSYLLLLNRIQKEDVIQAQQSV